jgi:hypothetical protein
VINSGRDSLMGKKHQLKPQFYAVARGHKVGVFTSR